MEAKLFGIGSESYVVGSHEFYLGALMEELKVMPFGAVWDEHCRRHDAPIGLAWLDEVKR